MPQAMFEGKVSAEGRTGAKIVKQDQNGVGPEVTVHEAGAEAKEDQARARVDVSPYRE